MEMGTTYVDRFKHLIPIIQSKLTAEEWQLILYRWVDGMPFEEIASITGQSRDQVAYRTSKATAKARYWSGVLLSRKQRA
jgi:DNA-directed RNA polymerase specialized sigma24 family protein